MRSIVGADANCLEERHQLQPRFRVPQDLPTSISRHIVPVTEPEDVLKEFQSRRERNYHLLIRRFIYQILYGCTDPACTTPTCLSYQKRTTKTPLRKLTPLSARTLACYLASESNPEAALCPHCPQVFPDHEQVPPVKRRQRRKSHNVTFESNDKSTSDAADGKLAGSGYHPVPDNEVPRPGVLVRSTRDAVQLEGVRRNSSRLQADEECAKSKTEKPARDSKSFAQNLFETLPLRMLEWLPFQPHRANGIKPRSPRDEGCEHDEGDEALASETSNIIRRDAGKPHHHVVPPTISRRPSKLVTSDCSPKVSSKGLRSFPNGEKRHFAKDTTQRPRHTTRPRMSKPEKERSSDSVEVPPTSLSFSHDDKAPYPRRLSPPFSVGWRQDMDSERVAPDQSSRETDDVHSQPISDNDEHDSGLEESLEESLATEIRDCPERNLHLPTHALAQIPSKTLTDLSLMQDRLEKYCLGYQITERRPWPHEPNPYAELALLFTDWTDFIKQSCFYLLKDSTRLARAFEWDQDPESDIDLVTWPTSILPASGLQIFGALYRLRPSEEILQFLSHSLDQVFLSTLGLLRPLRKQTTRGQKQKISSSGKQSIDGNAPGLSNNQAAFICAVVLYALARLTVVNHECSLPDHAERCWRIFCSLRSMGQILPTDVIAALDQAYESDCHIGHLKCLTDVFENDIALEIVSKLAKAISNRLTFSEISKAQKKHGVSDKGRSVLQMLIQYLKDFWNNDSWPSIRPRPLPLSSTTLEWLRTIVLREWDGEPIIRRAGTVGGALQMLAAMYEERSDLHLDTDVFHTPLFAERLDPMEMPVEWLSYQPDNKTFHLLSCTFLFHPSTLVTYFRALNFATMSKSFESALISSKHVSQLTSSDFIQVANDVQLLNVMRPAMATYFVLTVRRDDVLTDAMNQLWRRQKRELMRPLKVRMGMDEGEEGVDHGGVQQEFFRCLLAEALDPAYGMFTVDETTRMTWFQPRSLEPLYKFEMLGILFSIAVYNSITLPVTFPLAFYRKLLDMPVKKLNHIQDGWPELARGLQKLLDWSEGDVGDVFMRTYEFSFDAFGEHIDVDMQKASRKDPCPSASMHKKGTNEGPASESPIPEAKPTDADVKNPLNIPRSNMTDPQPPESSAGPSTPSSKTTTTLSLSPTTPTSAPAPAPTRTETSPPLVTNTNRDQYVKDHISHLTTHSIDPQFRAFHSGFHTCLTRPALSIFTPSALQSLIEGSQNITLAEWQSITKYEDGYTADTPLIRDFWAVVAEFDEERRKGLLEFVTASQRVPVGGWANVVFIVQRSGFDDARLPTSMTCFGRLLLPQYSGRGVLEEKLRKAIEHSKGFGVA